MHIAICDDSVGDRKQLERLLKRESDKRAGTSGVFYVDSYGSITAVMKSPMLYDAFFIDMVSSETKGDILALLLMETGVTVPIVLCSSSIDYKKTLAENSANSDRDFRNILFLDKPILTSALSDMLDQIISMRSDILPTIELRGEKDTRYVAEDDIVYAKAEGNYIHVILKDGSKMAVLSSIDNFYSQLSAYTHYAEVSRVSMINVTFLQKVSLTKLYLLDGTIIQTTPLYSSNIKKTLQQYVREL